MPDEVITSIKDVKVVKVEPVISEVEPVISKVEPIITQQAKVSGPPVDPLPKQITNNVKVEQFSALLILDRPTSTGIVYRSINYTINDELVSLTIAKNQRSLGLTLPNPVTLIICELDGQYNVVLSTEYTFTNDEVDNPTDDNTVCLKTI